MQQMKNIIKKLWKHKSELRSFAFSIWFNFHYLPFRQAMRLPILLYKPHLKKCNGSVRILAPIRYGLIRLGFPTVSIYPNEGIMWENKGADVTFYGSCVIGNSSYLSFGNKAAIKFGDDFVSTAGCRMVSYRGISFGQSSRIGYGSLIMDTNFHPLYDMVNKKFKSASGPIEIGDYNWFGTECKIMHSVKTPERCIFGMGTVVTRSCVKKSYCVMGGNPVRILTENVMRIIRQDTEEY